MRKWHIRLEKCRQGVQRKNVMSILENGVRLCVTCALELCFPKI